MKKIIITSIIIVCLAAIGVYVFALQKRAPWHRGADKGKTEMHITSPSFEDRGSIPIKFTCDEDGTSPELRVQDVPAGTQSLSIIMDDPDAPGGIFTHWVVWDIPADTTVVREGSAPAGSAEGKNSLNEIGYTAPCPPSGAHRYVFQLFALDVRLALPAGASRQDAESAMAGHILESATLTGIYSRVR